MTILLAIETSSETCSLALRVGGCGSGFSRHESRLKRRPGGGCDFAEGKEAAAGGRCASLPQGVLEIHEHAPLRHAELLLPGVERLLAEAGLALSALDAIAFGRGPGSFTSLRLGIGVVQGLAWAAGLPVVPVSSLAAVAQEACEKAPAASGRIRIAVDARMQEVFTAEFEAGPDGLVRPCGEERVCAPAALRAVAPPAIAAGNGFARFAELEPLCRSAVACFPDLWPRAAMILRLAEGWLATHAPLPAALAQPVYIRNKVAVKPDRTL